MRPVAFVAAMLLALPAVALAHGESSHRKDAARDPSKAEQQSFGRAGDPKRAKRTVTITMADTMRYSPATLSVKQGETVHFVVRNVVQHPTGEALCGVQSLLNLEVIGQGIRLLRNKARERKGELRICPEGSHDVFGPQHNDFCHP